MADGTCGEGPCTCSLRADECDGSNGIFMPGSANGECVVRPCRKFERGSRMQRLAEDFERRPAHGVNAPDGDKSNG